MIDSLIKIYFVCILLIVVGVGVVTFMFFMCHRWCFWWQSVVILLQELLDSF